MDILNLFDKIQINWFQKVVMIAFAVCGGWLLLRELIWKMKGKDIKDLYKPIDDEMKKADEASKEVLDELDDIDI